MVITESLGVGGTESHLLRVLPRLSALGWKVAAFCLSGRGELADDLEAKGVEVFTTTSAARPNIARHRSPLSVTLAANGIFWRMQRWHPQIAHFYLPGPYVIGAPIAMAKDIPVKIMSRRSLSDYQRNWPMVARVERLLHKRMDALVGNSQAVVDQLRSEGAPEGKVRLIYNGVDLPERLPPRDVARRELGLDENALVAVVVANLIPYKGHEDLIRGLGQAARRLALPWKVLFAGRDCGLCAKLDSLAQEQQIAENIQFLGLRSDVPRLLAAADLGLLTSHEEGFSNVILESMAAALPMIVTDVGGNPEAVVNERTGLVVPPHNPDAIGDAFLRLARAPELRERYGAVGKERVRQEFSVDRCVTAHAELYEELLSRVSEGRIADSKILTLRKTGGPQRQENITHPAPPVLSHLDRAKVIAITHVITGLGIGGSERSLLTIASRMDPERFKTDIVSLLEQGSSYDEAHSLGLRVTNLGMKPGLPTVGVVRRLMRHIHLARPTILQTWLYHSDLVGLLSGWLAGTPRIVWNLRCSDVTQGSWPMQLALRGMGVLSQFPDAVVVNSRQGRIAHERWNFRPRRWAEIGNCVDGDRFRPRPNERQELRHRLGFPPDATIIGYVARLHPMKDHQNFLKAARLLSQRRDNIQFVLCGKGCDPENSTLVKSIAALGIADHVHLLGSRLDVEKIYPTFDIAVSASAFGEGSSNTLLEAMASGVPCVATDVGDSSVILGSAGLVVRPRDPEGLARACEEILAANRALWGSRGRERAVKEFSIQTTVQQYEALYSELAMQP